MGILVLLYFKESIHVLEIEGRGSVKEAQRRQTWRMHNVFKDFCAQRRYMKDPFDDRLS